MGSCGSEFLRGAAGNGARSAGTRLGEGDGVGLECRGDPAIVVKIDVLDRMPACLLAGSSWDYNFHY